MTRAAAAALAWLVFAAAALALIAMPAASHDWMTQMDPAVAPGSIAEADNPWPAIAAVAMVLAVGAQAAVLRLSRGRATRAVSIALILAALAVWLLRFVL